MEKIDFHNQSAQARLCTSNTGTESFSRACQAALFAPPSAGGINEHRFVFINELMRQTVLQPPQSHHHHFHLIDWLSSIPRSDVSTLGRETAESIKIKRMTCTNIFGSWLGRLCSRQCSARKVTQPFLC